MLHTRKSYEDPGKQNFKDLLPAKSFVLFLFFFPIFLQASTTLQ